VKSEEVISKNSAHLRVRNFLAPPAGLAQQKAAGGSFLQAVSPLWGDWREAEPVTTQPFVGLEPSDILAPPWAVLAASLRQVAKLAPVHASREQSWRECSGSEGKGAKTKTTRLGGWART